MKRMIGLLVVLVAAGTLAGEFTVHTSQTNCVPARGGARRGFVIVNTSTNNVFIAIGATNEIARLVSGGSWTECGTVPQGDILLRGASSNTTCYAGDW